MTLRCDMYGMMEFREDKEPLIQEAAQFSRFVEFCASPTPWTEKQMLRVLALPCMQHLTQLDMASSSQWADSPLVQAALFGMPRLTTVDMRLEPWMTPVPSVVAMASQLTTVRVEMCNRQPPAGSLRALRLAPSLTSLTFGITIHVHPFHPDLVWCLPPTLRYLGLRGLRMLRDLPRPLVKALFSHTPLLSSLQLRSASLEAILRGLLDAGVAALPSLRSVTFERMRPVDCSVDIVPDPLESIFRRFVRRFPQVNVRIEFLGSAWANSEELRVVQMRYVGWSSVQMYCSDSQDRLGGPMIPRLSDDDSGSDVEELKDPLAAVDR